MLELYIKIAIGHMLFFYWVEVKRESKKALPISIFMGFLWPLFWIVAIFEEMHR